MAVAAARAASQGSVGWCSSGCRNFHHQDWPSLRDNDRHHVVAPPSTHTRYILWLSRVKKTSQTISGRPVHQVLDQTSKAGSLHLLLKAYHLTSHAH